MSLMSIISQLQSIQPNRRKMTADSIALDLLKTRNSLIKLARLLQNSGTAQSNRFVPRESLQSKQDSVFDKRITKATAELNQQKTDNKRFKEFVQQSVKQLNKEIATIKNTNKRNEQVIKSMQSEIGLGRQQRAIRSAYGASASQVPSYGRSIKGQLNRLNQQINVLNINQQRIIEDNERLKERAALGMGGGIPGRTSSIPFKQRYDYLQRIKAAETREWATSGNLPMPDISNVDDRERRRQLVKLFGGVGIFMASTAAGRNLLDKLDKLNKMSSEDLEKISEDYMKTRAGEPYALDDELKLKKKIESQQVQETNKKLKELSELLKTEKDPTKKDQLTKQIEEVKKQRLDILKREGIITQEHVAANMAKDNEITFYQYKPSADAATEYVARGVVDEYPEVWKVDDSGFAVLQPKWQDSIRKDATKNIPTIRTREPLSATYGSYAEVPFEEVQQQIMTAEGTLKEGVEDPYNVVFGFGQYGEPDKPLTDMTIAEVNAFQKRLREATKQLDLPGVKGAGTSAVGAYQFTEETLKDIAKEVFKESWERQKFTKDTQDKLAKYLFDKRKTSNKSLSGTWAYFRNLDEEGGRILREQTSSEAISAERLPEAPADKTMWQSIQERLGKVEKKVSDFLDKFTPPGVKDQKVIQMGGIPDNTTVNLTTPESISPVKVVDDVTVQKIEETVDEKTLVAETQAQEQQLMLDQLKTVANEALAKSIGIEAALSKYGTALVKNSKGLNEVREMVRIGIDVGDFSVRNPRSKDFA